MAPQTTTYLFARLIVLPEISSGRREEVIEKGLRGKRILVRDLAWTFLEVRELVHEQETYFHGSLAKYRPQVEEKVVDEATKTVGTKSIENALLADAPFFIDPQTMLVAFRTAGSEIPEDLFRDRFAKLFREAHGKFFMDPRLDLITEEFTIWEALAKFDHISRFSVTLRPSNPRSRDLWKAVDDDLQRLNAKQYKEEYVGATDSHGLRLANEPVVQAKIQMAADGYGEATITGSIGGLPRSASTGENPASVEVVSQERDPVTILSRLVGMLREIRMRGSGG